MRLSDLVEREHAEELARSKMPKKFKWEVNRKTDSTSIPQWIVEAMIEYDREY